MINCWPFWFNLDCAYRPLIFHSDGEFVGQYQEFPPPNNINRKLRSIANIERIGLFSPQIGLQGQAKRYSGTDPLFGSAELDTRLDGTPTHHSPEYVGEENNAHFQEDRYGVHEKQYNLLPNNVEGSISVGFYLDKMEKDLFF